MTTLWRPNGEWAGEAVAILGNGPAMTAAAAEGFRVHKCIAVNRAVKFAPWADMFVAIDPEHHAGMNFAGLKIVGCECDVDSLYFPSDSDRVTLAPGHVIEIRNNLLMAIRIAAGMGASKIILEGIDTAAYEEFHGFPGLTAALGMLVNEMRARGIEIEGGELSPLVYRPLMPGLGDAIHARAVLRELVKRHDVWFDTAWPAIVADLPVHIDGIPPAGAREVSCSYYAGSVMTEGSVLAAMSKAAGVPIGDFRLDVPQAWKDKVAALIADWQPIKPIMVLRPLVSTGAGINEARNPDPAAYRALYESVRGDYFVVSVAHGRPGVESLAQELDADVKCHAGEMDLETLVALFAAAKLVFCPPGFAVVMAQAVSTAAVCVFGGYENARSFTCDYAPQLAIEPITPCPCWSPDCNGDKTIDVPAAMQRVKAFIASL